MKNRNQFVKNSSITTLLSIFLFLVYSNQSHAYQLLDPNPTSRDYFGGGVHVLPSGNILVVEGISIIEAAHLYAPGKRKPINSYYGGGGSKENSLKIHFLTNGNFVVSSWESYDGQGGVRLIDGLTGKRIGQPIIGNAKRRSYALSVDVLPNGNYVVRIPYNSHNERSRAGTVMLISGTTGEVLGEPLEGDNHLDSYGAFPNDIKPIEALSNGNFVVLVPTDKVNGIKEAGSIILVNGSTGEVIGEPLVGDEEFDFSRSNVTGLPNGNFVVVSPRDNVNGVVDAGSIRLMSGTTGETIGEPFIGNRAGGYSFVRIVSLSNSNYVVAAPFYDKGRLILSVGSATLVNG